MSLAGQGGELARARVRGCGAAASGSRGPVRAPTVVNATRWAIHRKVVATGWSVEVGTVARSKWNLQQEGLERRPATLAACVGAAKRGVLRWVGRVVLGTRALGRGHYQRTQVNARGFPRGYLMRGRSVHGCRSGDVVRPEASSPAPGVRRAGGCAHQRELPRGGAGRGAMAGVPLAAARGWLRYAYTLSEWGAAAGPGDGDDAARVPPERRA